ncbi:MAG: hypothetical protein M3Q39_02205 [Actinomycetota bacterium]|nr:hypothetical protein [Actinomycetota bacterium]
MSNQPQDYGHGQWAQNPGSGVAQQPQYGPPASQSGPPSWAGQQQPSMATQWPQGQGPQRQAPQQSGPTNESDDFFGGGGGGAPSFKFQGVGHDVTGIVLSCRKMDQTVFGKNPPQPIIDQRTGKTKQQLQVVLQTKLTGWADVTKIPTRTNPQTGQPEQAPASDDDGKRAIYVKGWMIGAIQDAIAAAGKSGGLEIGAKLAVRVTELVPTDQGNPYAKYLARYAPPAADAGFFQEQAPQQQQQQQQQQQAWGQPQAAPQGPPSQQAQQPLQGQQAFNGYQPPAQAPSQPQGAAQSDPWGGAPSYDEPPF